VARLPSTRIGWISQPDNRATKGKIMPARNRTTTTQQPMFRVSFSRITGQDKNGQDILGRAKEIGAIWPRKNGKQGGILSLDLIPIELTQRQGVVFITPVGEDDNGGSQ
jgi:hypothetical protein